MKNTLLIIAGVIIFGVLAFAVGVRFRGRFAYDGLRGGQFVTRSRMARMPYERGMMGKGYRGAIQGQISKIDNNNVMVQLPNGGTYTISVDDQTSILNATKVAKEDLKTGQNVSVFGGAFLNGVETILIHPQ